MDCNEAKTGLSPYLDGELPRHDAASVAQHLTACEECRRALEELARIGSLLRDYLAEAPSLDVRAKVMAAITDGPVAHSRQRDTLRAQIMRRWLRRMRTWPRTR